MSERAYIALGSNVGDRLSYLRRALKALKEHPEIRLSALSSVYETKPVGLTEQADFLNMVAAVDTALSPHALLDVTQGIEQALHRRREIRWGPRTLDIDILLYGNVTMEGDRLTIPHP
ncbi:MAG: 2-amino-4-hydroxy-6-hydroxymethyldihydropteridine diphosphokinase, partial [Novibacillus thermophilus]